MSGTAADVYAVRTFRSMNTEVEIMLESDARLPMEELLQEAEDWFAFAERTFSRFRHDSELARLNRSGGVPFFASASMCEVLSLAERYRRVSRGRFDPAVLPALERAGYDRSFERLAAPGEPPREVRAGVGEAPALVEAAPGELPREVRAGVGEAPALVEAAPGEPPRELRAGVGEAPALVEAAPGEPPREVRAGVGEAPAPGAPGHAVPGGAKRERRDAATRGVASALPGEPPAAPGWTLEPRLGVVTLAPGCRLDLGGIVKSWTVERLASSLRAHGVASGVVNAGGDLTVWGATDDNPWPVELADPWDGELVRARVRLTRGAAATSSAAKRRWTSPDGTRHHLIDPRTMRPGDSDVAQCTVVGEDAIACEIYAKVVCLLGREPGAAWLAQAAPHAEALLVTHAGEALYCGSETALRERWTLG